MGFFVRKNAQKIILFEILNDCASKKFPSQEISQENVRSLVQEDVPFKREQLPREQHIVI